MKTLYAKKGSQLVLWGQLTLALLALLLLFVLSIFAINEFAKNATDSSEDFAIVRVLAEAFKSSDSDTEALNDKQFLKEVDSTAVEQRKVRQVEVSGISNISQQGSNVNANKSMNQTSSDVSVKSSQGYYEEQMPVLVHSESGPILGYRQAPAVPSQQASAEPDPYYSDFLANDQDTDQQQADYGAQDVSYYERGQQTDYYNADEDGKDNVGSALTSYSADAAPRSDSKINQYDSYYHQWNTQATTRPFDVNENRRMSQRVGVMQDNRDADDIYGDYDYSPHVETSYSSQQRPMQKQQQQQQQQQKIQQHQQFYPQLYRQRLQSQRNRATNAPTVAPTTERPQESTLLSVVKQLKNMWDIYQAFTTAWNVIAEHSQKTQQQQKQQQEQQQQKEQQLRINSRQPPKFVAAQKRNSTAKATKNKTTTTTTTTELPPAKNEPRHKAASTVDTAEEPENQSEREKRQSSDKPIEENADKAVAEGRYIKGDPLKGYYDFVITEGSYKFWAVFQVGTAILIIYSTFAAIYYSKVNPLVSDYDYTDYLGGARALTGSDLDFIDDDDAAAATSAADGKNVAERTSRWLDWMPNMGHSVKFILDAIDKLPVDHANVEE